MWTSTLSGIKSQKGQADRIRLTKQCKIIGQKSDKAKSKLLKQEVFSREGKVLQNLDTPVRSWAAPPTLLSTNLFQAADGVQGRGPLRTGNVRRAE
jgi:hypothetical protein